jgi:hypothetical protein
MWRHTPALVPWSINKKKIEIEVTSDCNLRCYNCNRAVRHAPSSDGISVEQVERFVGESLDLAWRWHRIALCGGEPTLHPRLLEILQPLERYRRFNPVCTIALVTNGYGNAVNDVLSRLPAWVHVKNTKKSSPVQEFDSYNRAPLDVAGFAEVNFSRGCRTVEQCGLGLSRNGFYACGPGASVDRVFGFDIGLKSLSLVEDARLREQLQRLCGYCGLFRRNYGAETITEELMSVSWQRALERYRRSKPVLSLY